MKTRRREERLINDPLDAVFDTGNVEIDQESEPLIGKLEMA